VNEENGRRFSDEMLIRLEQKFTDHDEWEKGIFKNFEGRINRLEEFKNQVEKPIHAAGWIIIGLIASFVAAVGAYTWNMLTRLHFR
jgi:hypothetical protein